MSSKTVNFDWSSVLKEKQGTLLESGKGSDLTILVGPSHDGKQEEFKVHRSIVSLWSPVLESEITKLDLSKGTHLVFEEVDSDAMRAFLKFVYTGACCNDDDDQKESEDEPDTESVKESDDDEGKVVEGSESDGSIVESESSNVEWESDAPIVEWESDGSIVDEKDDEQKDEEDQEEEEEESKELQKGPYELFKTANYFQCQELADVCAETIKPLLNKGNALEVFKTAMQVGNKQLIKYSMDLINRNAEFVLESEEFLNLSIDCVFEIVKQDHLEFQPELKVFNRICDWGKAECQRQGLDSNDPLQLRTVMDKLIKWIRFPVMTTKQYKEHVVPKKLLQISEVECLLTFFMTPQEERSSLPELLFIAKPRRSRDNEDWSQKSNKPYLIVRISRADDDKVLYDIKLTDKVLKLKNMLFAKFGYPKCLEIKFRGDVLSHNKSRSNNGFGNRKRSTLADYGISNGSRIELSLKKSEVDKEFCDECNNNIYSSSCRYFP